MSNNMQDLSNDPEITARLKNFHDSIEGIEEVINLVNDKELYAKLSNSDKIKYNTFLSFTLNSLFWMYLKAEGVDPMKHQIKSENDRLKQVMARAKQINDRNTIMPRINKGAAQRFVRNSLWDAQEKQQNKQNKS